VIINVVCGLLDQLIDSWLSDNSYPLQRLCYIKW